RASHAGRTWKMTALSLRAEARSRMAMSSACCWAVVRPGLEGQQELPTVAIQAARNSRAGTGRTMFVTDDLSSAAKSVATGHSRSARHRRRLQFQVMPGT